MKPHDRLSSFETLSLAERRAALLLGFRWRDKSRREKALAELPSIRRLLAPKSKGFDSVSCIRKMRETR